MSRAWMPLYWGDYLRDTRDLTTLQHGAYLLLIGHYWQHGSLPQDEKSLAVICGLSRTKFVQNRKAIASKFGSNWYHPRIEKEIAKADAKAISRAIAGQKGGFKSGISKAIAIGNSKQKDTNHISKKERAFLVPQIPARSLATALPSGALARSPLSEQDAGRGGQGNASDLSRTDLEAIFAARRKTA